MIDFHTHSFLSDGELVPSELARRAEAKGYRAIGISDHVDGSNADFVIPRLVAVCRELSAVMDIVVIAGAEITHVPPPLIASMVKRCRALGAEYLIVHGETVVEPVKEGTNEAALKSEIDILAHPGMVTPAQAREAAARGILLEVSSRKGNCLANGHVARLALDAGAKLIIGSDAHDPADLITREEAAVVARGAGLGDDDAAKAFRNAEGLLNAIVAKRK
ncbi:MAG: histidinol phosphate phosphatase domain-containing protein [bacterium]